MVGCCLLSECLSRLKGIETTALTLFPMFLLLSSECLSRLKGIETPQAQAQI